ncbi:TPA: complement inhibitor SCIN family protein [Staphylococcus delphini]|nr:complement inhibitor SCIN family protein [Staphylococcus delphini]HEC2149125.1 complement inhibitor SCIN family protein [Staphylococcus delphini]HEC2151046.1 complement inhibitor SCIN family protein [Staphylococcus delphini]HEC2161338.1 complement inhibitor SCIN family protein [Staphylococcus delphini]HEC2169393.1 complement inhibitor SCIN family protein [Staphylococcus delphini]
MKFKKYILSTSVAVILSSTLVTTTTNQAEASTGNSITASEYYDSVLKSKLQALVSELNVKVLSTSSLEPYYKRQVNVAGFKAKVALKSGNYRKMAEAKANLESVYKEIEEALKSTY